jgi:hypothetical protein
MNSSVSQAAFSVFGLGTVEHILGIIEGEFKKKQEEAEKTGRKGKIKV